MPEAVPTVTPASPGALMLASGFISSVTSPRLPRALPQRDPSWPTRLSTCQSRRVASQPKNSTAAVPESGRWRTVTELMRRSSSRQIGGSKLAATRSRHGVERSQARSTT